MKYFITFLVYVCVHGIAFSDPVNEITERMEKIIGYDTKSNGIFISCIYKHYSSAYVIKPNTNELSFVSIKKGVITQGSLSNPLIKGIKEIVEANDFFHPFSKKDKTIMNRGKDGLVMQIKYQNKSISFWSPIYLSIVGIAYEEEKLDKDLINYIKIILKLNFIFPEISDQRYLKDLGLLENYNPTRKELQKNFNDQAKLLLLEEEK